jgi:hypothetical protein
MRKSRAGVSVKLCCSAQIALNGRGKPRQVSVGQRSGMRRARQSQCDFSLEVGSEASRPLGEPAVGHHQQQEQVGNRPRPCIAPRRGDHRLRQHQREGTHYPPPLSRGREHGCGEGDQQCCEQPQHAQAARDWLCELGQRCQAKRLGKAYQVDETVQNQDCCDKPTHRQLPRLVTARAITSSLPSGCHLGH